MNKTLKIGDQHRIITSNFSGMAQVTNVKTVKTKEQNGVLVEYLVENYGQSADFFVPDGAILDGQIDSRRVRSGMPVEYMSKDGKDFDWGQYSEDVEIQKRIANAFVYSFATFRKQGRGLYIYSSTKGSGKTLLACCLANEVLKKQDVSIKFATVADYIELVRSSKNEAVKEQMNAIMNTGLLIVDDIGATKEDKHLQEDKENTDMSKKENTTGTTMATEIIRDMKRRETEAIGELSGILMDLDKVLYTLEVVQENSDIVGKSVNDGALFMMNRNRIYQNSSIAHDYVRGFEQKLAKTIDTLDTDDITEEEPAGDSNTDSAGETHTQEMESKKKFIVKTVEGIEAEKAINMIYAFVRKLAAEE